MHEEHLPVDKASPVVDPLEFESRLYGRHVEAFQILFESGAVSGQAFQEVIARVEAQHTVFGITFFHVLGKPTPVVPGKLGRGRQQVVGVERCIEIRVEFEERVQVVFGVGLPFGITEEMDGHFRILADGYGQVGQEPDKRHIATRSRHENVFPVGT